MDGSEPMQSLPQRLIAVGDIHGQLEKLENLLAVIKPTAGDGFIFLGDYIDRGPNSVETIDFLIEFGQKYASIFLRGNHEQMMLDYLNSKDEFWFGEKCGGSETREQYERSSYKGVPDHHIYFINQSRLLFSLGDFVFVHAGLRPNIEIADQDERDLLWIRAEFTHSIYDWGKVIVYGHTPQSAPLILKNRICLDTGAAYGHELTACDVLTRRIWSK